MALFIFLPLHSNIGAAYRQWEGLANLTYTSNSSFAFSILFTVLLVSCIINSHIKNLLRY